MSLHLKNLIDVTRLSKPIGFLLLFWPCAWGLSLAHYFQRDINTFFSHLVLFFFGSVLMRSAGCIVNDIVDENIDKKVLRTKRRPIASGSLSKKLAWTYVLILCSLAFVVLIQFNLLTIYLGIFSMIFAFSYPFMKRFTYWPQLFLGFTFNWGIIMAWTSITNEISYFPILLYCGAIFWTLGYDTIYGLQDRSDDELIGVKSTSIKFRNNLNLFLGICYSISSFLIFLVIINLKIDYYFIFFLLFMFTLFYQIKIYNTKDPASCLKAFKINNISGLTVFLAIYFLTI
jgi:4-hydroxybenzoate polyprenyl transferase